MARLIFSVAVMVAVIVLHWNTPLSAQAVQLSPGAVFRDCVDCPEMVVIPAGSALIGSKQEETTREGFPENLSGREKPQHEVRITKPFAVSKFEVTKRQYAQFVKETDRAVAGDCTVWDFATGRFNRQPEKSWLDPGFSQVDVEPVVCVSWDDSKAFVAWLSRKTDKAYRLLTEAEWEYAARAGTVTTRYWGDDRDQACAYANIFDLFAAQKLDTAEARANPENQFPCVDGIIFTAEVGSFLPNPFGLHDMIGNASEWVEDCWHENYEGAASDGSARTSGDCKRRVLRGGGWDNIPRSARAAYRGRTTPDNSYVILGFRLARTL
ncbi:MAG: formylglycine-generating enzyme family protein [Rhodospirillaceae bacterium]